MSSVILRASEGDRVGDRGRGKGEGRKEERENEKKPGRRSFKYWGWPTLKIKWRGKNTEP